MLPEARDLGNENGGRSARRWWFRSNKGAKAFSQGKLATWRHSLPRGVTLAPLFISRSKRLLHLRLARLQALVFLTARPTEKVPFISWLN
jgi:hypothetical protein